MANNDKPRISAQRGTNGAGVIKTAKAPATFQPGYANGALQLNGPSNNRRGALSLYAKDLVVYVAALEKEVLGLRDKQSSLETKITELNSTVTALEERITANNEQHLRDLAEAKNATRTANTIMDVERTRANMAEALEDTRQQIHDLFDGASLSELSATRGTMNGAPVRSAFFTCAGLRFSRRVSSTDQSLTVWSAPDNPIRLRDHVITRFAGNDLHVADKAHLRFLREAATVEGYELNKKRLSSKELEQLYRMDDIVKVFSCGHSVIEHIKMREKLLQQYIPAIVSVVFERLESSNGTGDHHVELIRAVVLFTGGNEATINTWAKNKAKENKELDRAKRQLRDESFAPEMARALGEYALSDTMAFDEVLDLRPENLRLKPKGGEALRLIRHQDGPLYHGAPGLHGQIQPISEYNRDRFSNDPYGENHLIFPSGDTHDLGIDSLYDGQSGQNHVDDRPAAKDIKPGHSGDCRNNGLTEGCTHESHRP